MRTLETRFSVPQSPDQIWSVLIDYPSYARWNSFMRELTLYPIRRLIAAGAGRHAMAYENRWLPGFNFNVEEWDVEGSNYETRWRSGTLALARGEFKLAVAEKPAGRFMICSRTRVVKRHPEGDW